MTPAAQQLRVGDRLAGAELVLSPPGEQGLGPSRGLSTGTVGSSAAFKAKILLSCSLKVAVCPSVNKQLPVISFNSLGGVSFAEV